jgi:HAMP domain-containing protein
MGYFDGLTEGQFKVAEDGRRLFFPRGLWGRGYVVDSESEFQRLRRQMKIYQAVALVLIIAAVVPRQYNPYLVIAVALLLIVFYLVWSRSLAARLQPAEDRLRWQETSAAQARAFGPFVLWFLEIVTLAFVALGIAIWLTDPTSRLLATGTIAFFGLCAAYGAYLLVLRGRKTSTRR